jgi:DNA-directed RNA polymerase II subunit RPB11
MNAPDRLEHVRVPFDKKKVSFEVDPRLPNAGTFVIQREDHTVGHLLRIELLRDPNVRFAAYRHPHPLDNHIELKVQVASSTVTAPSAVIEATNNLLREIRSIRKDAQDEMNRRALREDEF